MPITCLRYTRSFQEQRPGLLAHEAIVPHHLAMNLTRQRQHQRKVFGIKPDVHDAPKGPRAKSYPHLELGICRKVVRRVNLGVSSRGISGQDTLVLLAIGIRREEEGRHALAVHGAKCISIQRLNDSRPTRQKSSMQTFCGLGSAQSCQRPTSTTKQPQAKLPRHLWAERSIASGEVAAELLGDLRRQGQQVHSPQALVGYLCSRVKVSTERHWTWPEVLVNRSCKMSARASVAIMLRCLSNAQTPLARGTGMQPRNQKKTSILSASEAKQIKNSTRQPGQQTSQKQLSQQAVLSGLAP